MDDECCPVPRSDVRVVHEALLDTAAVSPFAHAEQIDAPTVATSTSVGSGVVVEAIHWSVTCCAYTATSSNVIVPLGSVEAGSGFAN